MNEERDRLSTADIASRDKISTRPDGAVNDASTQPESLREVISEEPAPKEMQHPETPLLPGDLSREYGERWTEVQSQFVDEPKEAVGQADELVADVIQKLAQRFAEERQKLERQWASGEDVSTEDLRLALQHYRSFFQRLLAA